jgi:hypothetical protein
MNGLAPIVAACIVASLARRGQARRRPYLSPTALPLFAGATAGLTYEAYYLRPYGFSFAVWWFPWLGCPWPGGPSVPPQLLSVMLTTPVCCRFSFRSIVPLSLAPA